MGERPDLTASARCIGPRLRPQGLLEQRVASVPPFSCSGPLGLPSSAKALDRSAQGAFAMATMAQDLRFLLSERGVSPEVVGQLEASGLVTLSLFYLSADTKAEVRTLLRAQPFNLAPDAVGIDAAERLRRTVAQAQILDAWVAAEARIKERTATEATQRAGSLPLTLPSGEQVAIRRRYEEIHGRVEDSAFPSEALIDRRLQEVEQHNLVAEPLTEVTSRAEGNDDPMSAVFDKDGSLRLRKGSSKVPLPADSEALRRRLNVLAVSFVIAKDRNPSCAWLLTATHEAWREHVEYVLGEKVYGLRVPGLEGHAGPDWGVVLAYDHALRKEAVRGILYEGLNFQQAMKRARTNTELRELSFVAPTMAAIFSRAKHGSSSSHAPPAKRAKKERTASSAGRGAKGSGKSGTKSKGHKGQKGSGSWHVKTADGSPICFAYNSLTERCEGRCGRVHCCQLCLGSHPAHRHDTATAAAAASASA